MGFLKIATERLLLVAGIVWAAAGLNIAGIGIGAYLHGSLMLWLLAATFVIFVLFHLMFTKLVKKHDGRIRGYGGGKTNVFRFFDVKSYLVMAAMMAGGIALRLSGVVPEWFIAFFYTGLGAALALAGASFIIRYFKSSQAPCPVLPRKPGRPE